MRKSRMLANWSAVCFALCLVRPLTVSAAPPQPYDLTVNYRLLLGGHCSPNGGFHVTWVDPAGPGTRVWSTYGWVALEPGDVISTINGRPIMHPGVLYRELAGSSGRAVRLTVVDCRTGTTLFGSVVPVAIYTDAARTMRPITPPFGGPWLRR
jgi:S1-C subfamily serine protease